MQVIKRDGTTEAFSFDKITNRIRALCTDLPKVDPVVVTQAVAAELKDHMTTSEIDVHAATKASVLNTVHPTYGLLAGRILASNLQKNTLDSFGDTMKLVQEGKGGSDVDAEFLELAKDPRIQAAIKYDRDFLFDYFGFKTLERTYFLKVNEKVVERPQHVYMRAALNMHRRDIDAAIETYEYMSQLYFTHATPTLLNSGLKRSQMSSCFLLQVKDDSVDGIFDTAKQCALISKYAGGVGLAVHDVRAAGSPIRGTNGTSNGIVPMIRMFETVARYIDQCFAPETTVYTTHGPKRISNIVVGDEVFGQDGNPERVNQVFVSTDVTEVLRIELFNGREVCVSAAHPIYSYTEKKFVEAGKLKVGDRVGCPTNVKHERDVIEYTVDDCRFYGMMVDCGEFYSSDLKGYVRASSDSQKEFVSSYLESHGCRVTAREDDMGCVHFKVDVPGMFKFTPAMFSSGGVHPSMYHLPLPKANAIALEIDMHSESDADLDFLWYTRLRANEDGDDLEITSIETEEYKGALYDLKTDGPTHTYMTEMGLAHNGGGKRKGSFAIYLEPWHADIENFLRMKSPRTKTEVAAVDLFYGMWINDLFMKRMIANEDWTLFSPDSAPGLAHVWGDEFEALYTKYEAEGRGVRKVKAMDIWNLLYTAQVETGVPYMQFKDAANRTSNQKHLGTIQCSNLCTEIMQFTSPDEVAVCNLASICLPKFLHPETYEFDFDKLRRVAGIIVRNLNKVIDLNYYPVEEARNSNQRHRPIGVGVQGLADVFMAKGLPFDSTEARELNKLIFETIQFGCVEASCALAKKDGVYSSYAGSPASQGILQMDMWPGTVCKLDWTQLRADVAKYGLRNSLLTAPMPTASTSQICGNSECIEPYVAPIFSRKTLAGSFTVINKWMVRDLEKLGLWNDSMKQEIVRLGSLQNIDEIPTHLKLVHRTAYEIPQKNILQMAADRAPFIDQSQSLNVYVSDVTSAKFTALHKTAWSLGLSGTYYFSTEMQHTADKFSIDTKKRKLEDVEEQEGSNKKQDCTMCSA